MLRRQLFLALAIVPVLLAGSNDRYKEDFRFNHKLNQGGRVSLEGFNGSIEIRSWEKNEIEVAGTKYASSEELLKQIQVRISNTDDAITVRTERPEGRGWWNNGGGGVRYVIRVPRKVQLERIASSNGQITVDSVEGLLNLTTSNGGINVSSIRGSLDLKTSNGGISLRDVTGEMLLRTSNGGIRTENVTGSFDAKTSNGSVHGSLNPQSSSSPIRVASSNGRIDLTLTRYQNNEVRVSTSNSSISVNLPSVLNAQLRAVTSNGSVSTDFDVLVRGKQSKNSLEGKIGDGGSMIELTSSNGSIHLRKI